MSASHDSPHGYEVVIGLEIHAQLATDSKIFSGAATRYGASPNEQASAVDLAMPGVLPVLNEEAVRLAVVFGLSVGAEIVSPCVFARKNYFYPDLPKGYQISQFDLPIVRGGHVDITVGDAHKRVMLTRAHLEEDAGKSVHGAAPGRSGLDLNRAGVPLIEIVSEPDMRSASEAVAYMREVHRLVRYLGVCDGNMQEGSFRCDANVSLRPVGQAALGTRAELKNLNSFRFVERAINLEIERQTDVLDAGGQVVQETRLYDSDLDQTRSMRSKEEAEDYRYFPDPDLLPVEVDETLVAQLRDAMPELPAARAARYVDAMGVASADAAQLVESQALADYFEAAVAAAGASKDNSAKACANWLVGEFAARLNREERDLARDIATVPMAATTLGALVERVDDGTLSSSLAKDVFERAWNGEGTPDEIIEREGLAQVSDEGELQGLIDALIAESPSQVEQYRSGKQKVFGYFVGQMMKRTGGKADPAVVTTLLKKVLDT